MTGRFTSPETWTNEETGERCTFNVLNKDLEENRPGGFVIAYLGEIINMIDTLGNKKMQVVKYILGNMDKSNNTLIITGHELAKNSGVSYAVTNKTLNLLQDAGVIERRPGIIMLSPKVCNNWSPTKERCMLVRYRGFSTLSNKEQED